MGSRCLLMASTKPIQDKKTVSSSTEAAAEISGVPSSRRLAALLKDSNPKEAVKRAKQRHATAMEAIKLLQEEKTARQSHAKSTANGGKSAGEASSPAQEDEDVLFILPKGEEIPQDPEEKQARIRKLVEERKRARESGQGIDPLEEAARIALRAPVSFFSRLEA